MNNDTLINELTGKNEQLALDAAKLIIKDANTDAFAILVSKSEFLFDFIKTNVNRRLESAVSNENFRNLIPFLSYYSSDFEDLIAGSLAKYADEELTDELLELLEDGNDSQKTYCAKYFSFIPDTTSCEALMEYAFSENDSLAYNSAQALGAMKFEMAYKMALEMINSDDDFVILKAVKFLVAYGDTAAVPYIINAMKKSAMAENIAGEIPFLESLPALLHNENPEDALYCMSKILSGLGEILSLNQIFSFEMYDMLCELIDTNKDKKSGLIAVVLLKAKAKLEMLCENDIYTFDEDNNTKNELKEILNLLKSQDAEFWNEQKTLITKEFSQDRERKLSAVHLIVELKIETAFEELKKLIEEDDEIVLCEAVIAIKTLGKTNELDKSAILSKINDENKKAIIENCFIG